MVRARRGPRGGVIITCPACGREGTLIRKVIRGRTYLYVQHWAGGRKVHHYVGPASRHPELASLLGIEAARAAPSSLPLDFDEFSSAVRRLASEGNEHAARLLKRLKKDGGTIKAVLAVLRTLAEEGASATNCY